eukprot:Gb_00180 [translate_table: standard]
MGVGTTIGLPTFIALSSLAPPPCVIDKIVTYFQRGAFASSLTPLPFPTAPWAPPTDVLEVVIARIFQNNLK